MGKNRINPGTEGFFPLIAERVLYGRRGRPLSAYQKELVATLLPSMEIKAASLDFDIDPKLFFSEPFDEIWFEVGFGSGEHLVWQATQNPRVGFIGCEPYLNGVARLLSKVDKKKLSNIRIFRDDAQLLMQLMKSASIARAFFLFPDPWPKARHKKRRILNTSVINQLSALLTNNAELRIATDDSNYKESILQQVLFSGKFDWLALQAKDWQGRSLDWPETRYEVKANNAGRRSAFFRFRRKPRKH